MKSKCSSRSVRLAGSVAIYFGAFNFIVEHSVRYFRTGSLALNSSSVAIEMGITAIIVAGLLTLVIDRALKNIEERLALIESSNPQSKKVANDAQP
jgi:hypothetical protein